MLFVFTTVWLWSLIPLAVKVAYQSFNFAFIGFTRLAVGAVVFGAIEMAAGRGMRLPRRRPGETLRGPRWLGVGSWVVIAGVGIGADLLLYTLGLRHTTASAATLIVSADGVVLALLGVVVLRERMSWWKGTGALVALGGLVLVGWNGQDLSALVRSEYFLGNAIVLAAGCCWAIYAIGQRALAGLSGPTLFPIFLVGTLLAGTAVLGQPATHGPIRWQAVLAVLYLGLGGTGLAYVLLVKGIAKLEAATVGLIGSTLPVFTMVEAHFLMGEEITVFLVGGAALVIAGLALVMRHQQVYGAE